MLIVKALAFIKRDFRIDSSYQLQFIMTSLNSFIYLFLFYFISKLVDAYQPGLNRYGGNYFSYVMIGYAFYQYFQMILNSFSSVIRREQVTGCLETMLGTQTHPQICVTFSSFYIILYSTIQLLIIFMIGILFFDFSVASINILSALIVFLLSLFVFISFGIISVAFIIVLKKGDPFGWLIASSNFILGGAFFPIGLMPEWLRSLSKIIPATYTLDALRLAVLKGYTPLMLKEQVLTLLIMTVLLLPLSLLLLDKSIKKAKKDGSLVQY